MTSRNRAYAHPFSPRPRMRPLRHRAYPGRAGNAARRVRHACILRMHTTTQPDGTQVSYCIHGDENFSYFTSEDGSLLQRDPETGALHYVIDNGDGTLSLGAQANSAAPLAQDARSNDLATAEALSSDGARDAYQALEGISGRSVDVTPSFPLLTRNTANPLSLDQDVIQLPESIPLLTIVVGFSDEPYRNDYDWTQEMFTGQYSTSKFWSDASNSTFTFSAAPETSAQGSDGNTNQYDKENDGVVHVSLDMPHGNWGGFETDGQMESMVEMFVAAFEAADAYVDFSAFDKNGDAQAGDYARVRGVRQRQRRHQTQHLVWVPHALFHRRLG